MLLNQNTFKTPNVLVNGTFNIIHAGHIELFKYASSLGNLIVAVNNDPYLVEKYGSKAITLKDRISVIESIKYVSHIISFDEEDSCSLLYKIKPDFYIKGPDYLNVNIPEKDICKNFNIEYIVMKDAKILSTSKII
jgi:cytidyltransferase-like protein